MGIKIMSGIVKWYQWKRGVGFIVNENGEDVLFHRRDIPYEDMTEIEKYDRVFFEQIETTKGPRAKEVKLDYTQLYMTREALIERGITFIEDE